VVLFLVFICLILLVGCNSKDVASVKHEYHYYGEEEHWKATLDVSGKGDSAIHYEEKEKFVLEYKGDYSDISDAIVSYSYTENGETQGGTESPPGTKYIESSAEGSGSKIHGEDELIEVVVKWNDKEETIAMKLTND
jgi:hypothetical protein